MVVWRSNESEVCGWGAGGNYVNEAYRRGHKMELLGMSQIQNETDLTRKGAILKHSQSVLCSHLFVQSSEYPNNA